MATYTYDAQGRVLIAGLGDGGETDYAYDSQGNLQTVTAPSNNDAGQRPMTTYGYDPLGRVTSVTDPLGHATTYTYDNLGRVLTVTLPKPSTTSPLDFMTTYSYDNFDAASGLTYHERHRSECDSHEAGIRQFGRLVRSMDGLENATITPTPTVSSPRSRMRTTT